jgi:HSP20 family protein
MANILRQDDWEPGQGVAEWDGSVERMQPRPVVRSRARLGARVFPSVIISTARDRLVVRAEVPGMKLEEFDITVSGDTLTVQGIRSTGAGLEGGWYHRRERETGRFSRAIRLPAAVDGDRAEATYVSGVLTVDLPLREPAKPKAISVRVQEG